jgi:menaquinone-9 beta-reductase
VNPSVRPTGGELDIVIVGGGPAGLTLALALVHMDRSLSGRLAVLEKGAYPRDKYCAGALGGRGERILAELGAVPDVPSVPVSGMSYRGARGEQAQRAGRIGRVVRRVEFDHALARIALDRGISVIEGAAVERVEVDRDGAFVTTPRGVYKGRIVVGADGVGSVVRKAMGLSSGRLRAQVLEIDTEPTRFDRARDLLHFDASDASFAGYYWDFPTRVDGRELVCRGIYHLHEGAPRVGGSRVGGREARQTGWAGVDIREKLATRLSAMGLDIDGYKNKRFAERGLDREEVLSAGPFLLVGEAAGIDPVTGEGIAQAIEYGWLAGNFLAEVLSRKRELGQWTASVRRSRLGRDLGIRRRIVHAFFGRSRPAVDRLLVGTPAAVRSGGRHFGALPQNPLDLLEIGWGTAGVLAGSLRRRLRGMLGWPSP